MKVIAALLGFPDEDEHLLRPWSQAIVKMYEVNPSLEESQAEAQQLQPMSLLNTSESSDASNAKLKPGEDLISELATVEEAGEKLNAQELIATCVLSP